MKTFLLDLIPKLQRCSEKLDNLTLLQNHHWILLDEVNNSRTIYIFRESNELLLSYNGKVEKAKWEYLGNNTLLIDRKEESLLFKHGFFDENIAYQLLANGIIKRAARDYQKLLCHMSVEGSSIKEILTFFN